MSWKSPLTSPSAGGRSPIRGGIPGDIPLPVQPPPPTSPISQRYNEYSGRRPTGAAFDYDVDRERTFRAEAERDLLRAEHQALRSQLSDTRRLLARPLSARGVSSAVHEVEVAPTAPSKSEVRSRVSRSETIAVKTDMKSERRQRCSFITASPVEPVPPPPPPTAGESEIVLIHYEMVAIEEKIARITIPVQKRMGYKPSLPGSKPTFTTTDRVFSRLPIVTEDELAREKTLLTKWYELRERFDEAQHSEDVTESPEREATPRFESLKEAYWYILAVIGILILFYLYISDIEGWLMLLWASCFLTVAVWATLCKRKLIPVWLSLLVCFSLSLSSLITIMVQEEEQDGAGVAIATPILVTAAFIIFLAFTGRENYVLGELNSADNSVSDPVFRAVIEGDLAGLQRLVVSAPWKLRRRDDMTATPLHCALLRGVSSFEHRAIVDWITLFMPALALDVYTGNIFNGISGLHFAIIHRDKHNIHKFLHISPHHLSHRAVGNFFEEGSETYYGGEWPLLFAVSGNQPEIVAYVLQIGAERLRLSEKEHLLVKDTHGNNALHFCVYHNLPQMYDYVKFLMKEHKVDFGEDGTFNQDKFTPFTLAAHLGHKEIFEHLIDCNTDEVWQVGSCKCRRIWLDELDPINTRTHVKSVLQLLVDREHADLLMIPAVKELLLMKWKTFAERLWLGRFALLMCFVLAYSVVVFYGPLVRIQAENNSRVCSGDVWFGDSSVSFWWIIWCEIASYPLQRFCESVVLIGTGYRVMNEIKQMTSLPTEVYFGRRGSMLVEQLMVWMFAFCITCACGCRFAGEYSYEDLGLAFGALILWCHVLHELLGFRGTGPFVVMIWKMLGSDLMRFLIIFATFLIGFTQALYLLVNKYGAGHFFRRLMGCFVALLGQADVSALLIDEDSSHFPYISTALLLVYVLMVSILLLNLLIAMMTTTYSKIYDESDKVWNLEWARLIIALEALLTTEQKSQKGYKYWGEVNTPQGVRRFFLLPSSREQDVVDYQSVPPVWPPDAPQSVATLIKRQ